MSIETEHYELFAVEAGKLNKQDKNMLSSLYREAIVEINELIEDNQMEEELRAFCYDDKNYPNIKKCQEALKHMKNALFNYAKLNILVK